METALGGKANLCPEETPGEAPGPKALRGDVAVYGAANAVLKLARGWCKGCGICVEVCAKKCLALDAADRVEVVNLDACNRCLLCQLLCPDFAILVIEPDAWRKWSPAGTSGAPREGS